MQGLAGLRRRAETFCPFAQVRIVLFGNFELASREFHLAEIDRLVPAVDQQIDLRAVAFLCADIALHAAYTQLPFDLADMMQA